MCEICQNRLSINSVYDPTRTTTLRNLFAKAMDKRFDKLAKDIYAKVYTEDFFGLKIQGNKEAYQFSHSTEKVQQFMDWLKRQTDAGILGIMEYEQLGSAINKAWTNLYIVDSYKRGILRARYELQKVKGAVIPTMESTGGVGMSMTIPLHMDSVGLLYTRTFSDLKGITSAMDTQISRVLAQGMADGDNPLTIAKKLLNVINGSGGDLSLTDTLGRFIPAKRRAQILARTEIIRAHHQAMIQEYRNWALDDVVVIAEFLTAGDNRVCDECEAIAASSPYTLDEAANLIPVHPQCRCICLPFVEGTSTLIPKRTS